MEYYKNLSLQDLFYIDDDGLVCCEEWRDIVGYEGKYQASYLGRFKSLSRFIDNGNGGYISKSKILKANIDSDGYLLVSLCKNGKAEKLKMHRLVAQTFIPNPDNKPDVNHKAVDGDKTNICVFNLEWNTRAENMKHAKENNFMAKGEKHVNSKLTEKDILEIRSSKLTHRELGVIYGVNRGTITKITNNYRWAHI